MSRLVVLAGLLALGCASPNSPESPCIQRRHEPIRYSGVTTQAVLDGLSEVQRATGLTASPSTPQAANLVLVVQNTGCGCHAETKGWQDSCGIGKSEIAFQSQQDSEHHGTALHELGHAIGLNHLTCAGCVMNPEYARAMNQSARFAPEEAALLAGLYQ